MIKAKIHKNIFKKSGNSLGLNTKQIIVIGVAIVIAVLLYICLKAFISFSVLSTIIFIELLIVICGGVVSIQGMNLFTYFIKLFKGKDVRYYKQEGMFSGSVSEKRK